MMLALSLMLVQGLPVPVPSLLSALDLTPQEDRLNEVPLPTTTGDGLDEDKEKLAPDEKAIAHWRSTTGNRPMYGPPVNAGGPPLYYQPAAGPAYQPMGQTIPWNSQSKVPPLAAMQQQQPIFMQPVYMQPVYMQPPPANDNMPVRSHPSPSPPPPPPPLSSPPPSPPPPPPSPLPFKSFPSDPPPQTGHSHGHPTLPVDHHDRGHQKEIVWHLGWLMLSCNTVCAQHGAICDEAALNDGTADESKEVEAIAQRLGQSCSYTVTEAEDFGPAICAVEGDCIYALPSPPKRRLCSTSSFHYKRICPCSA